MTARNTGGPAFPNLNAEMTDIDILDTNEINATADAKALAA